MAFDLEKLIVDVFAPREGDVVTIMCDIPHGGIAYTRAWRDRLEMAREWREAIAGFAGRYGMIVNPLVHYQASGRHNADLPELGECDREVIRLEDILAETTILFSMPEYSASAPLVGFTKRFERLRAASMPTVSRSMEQTALSADYGKIAETCAALAPLFEQAEGMEVSFSTGHTCHFDISDNKPALRDDGRLHPDQGADAIRLRNLPSGEVCTVPNEAADSLTAGEIPVILGDETMVFEIRGNRIVRVAGDGPAAGDLRRRFADEPVLGNIAEVAIGCNDRAAVTGNILEDEKAGFHWAYGRSEHLGGIVGPGDFSSPDMVCHQDFVYAKGNPIVCRRLDFIMPDGTRRTVVVDGDLQANNLGEGSTVLE